VAKEGVSHTIEITWEFLRDVKVEQYADELKQLGLADAMRERSNDKILFRVLRNGIQIERLH
jgi:DNA-binding PucR family transcriptional regulator